MPEVSNCQEIKTSYYQDGHVTVYNKDCRSMAELPDESVQCVVTSPPYWGLRKYAGNQDLVWGGENHHEHEWIDVIKPATSGSKDGSGLEGGKSTQDGVATKSPSLSNTCSICGAWRGAFGLEPTVEMYVQHTVEILREIRRVLRKDGVCFLNLGDSYASGKGTCFNPGGGANSLEGHANLKEAGAYPLDRGNKSTLEAQGLKPKDLCLIPFRVALAAQADGWWVRSVIIWNKLNPMPESVRDRPTESHEYILMLTKSATYFWDMEAVREQSVTDPDTKAGCAFRSVNGSVEYTHAVNPGHKWEYSSSRNLRSVWTFPTQPYKNAHFAVYPEKLPELCIKAATPEVGSCAKCGKPWVRILDYKANYGRREEAHAPNNCPTKVDSSEWREPTIKTLGWRADCECNTIKPQVPSIVLDPFAGSGTTLWVAKTLNRRAVGYEISEDYCRLIVERNKQQVLL